MSTQKLFDILPQEFVTEVKGSKERSIIDLTLDSREVGPNWGFIAKKGVAMDGHRFISNAINSGAKTIFCEVFPEILDEDVTYVKYKSAEKFIGNLAHSFFDFPSQQLELIGITGTNGKSSIATMLYQVFTGLGYKSGLFSTIENIIAGRIIPSKLTTPDPISLNRMLGDMVKEGCDYAFMEVSSHALDQGRAAGLNYAVAVFTNITRDHLDYHKTFKEYIHAKQKLFDGLSKKAIAITNIDDRNGGVMVQNSKASIKKYGMYHPCDYKGRLLSNSIEGMLLEINGNKVHYTLSGGFNASNLLAVFAVTDVLDFDNNEVFIQMSRIKAAEGRFQKIIGAKKKITAIVDYAHTPDALQKVVETIREVKEKQARLITIVGCGGDRDKGKRPIMAKVAAQFSEMVILTSDNPRSEDPEKILDDMEAGIGALEDEKVLRITDRKQAIKTACSLANAKDIILVAGKGHEKYQEINGKKFPFDDKKVLEDILL